MGATVRNLREGSLDGRLTLFILLFGLPGVIIGAHLAITQGNRWIKRVFEVITLLVGAKLIVG